MFCCLDASAQFYDGSKTDFGKNRVQYDDFEWKYFRFKQYETFFYTGGKDLAIYTAKSAKKYFKEFEDLLDFYVEDRIQFLVYNKQSHFNQSNVGIVDERSNVGGVNNIVGNKVFLYFNGDHDHFEAQIRSGIARVFVYQMMYGGGWKDAVKNSTLQSYPEWYIEGLVSYISRGWDAEVDNRVKDGVSSKRYKKFVRLEGEESIIAGHSLWYFVAQTYGEDVVPNILYMTKLSRNVETGFLFVLGVPLKALMSEWLAYFEEKYESADRNFELPNDDEIVPVKIKKDRVYKQLKVSPDGSRVAYLTNQMGQYKVYIYDETTGKRKKILKDEHKLDRLTDYSYPILAWHPTGEILSIIREKKGKLFLHFYEVDTRALTTKPIFKLEKVVDFAYSPNGRNMVFSAMYEGKSDIYIYNIPGNTQKKVTDDFYDDLNPRYVGNNQIVFSSNRKSDTLSSEDVEIDPSSLKKDLFIYTIPKKRKKKDKIVLRRLTETPYVDELHPMNVGGDIGYLKEVDGIVSRHVAKYDSAITNIDTTVHYRYFYNTEKVSNYSRNIMEHDASVAANRYAEVVYNKGKYNIYTGDLKAAFNPNNEKEQGSLIDNRQIENDSVAASDSPATEKPKGIRLSATNIEETSFDENEIDINNYEFLSHIGSKKAIKKKKTTKRGSTDVALPEAEGEFVLPGQRNYNLSFSPNNSVMQLNSAFLNQQYQNFNGGPFISPGLGASFIFGITDVFEDYRVFGGFRYSGDNREYSLNFQNLSKRLDKEYLVSMTTSRQNQRNTIFDVKTYRGAVSLKWPFSEVLSIRGVVDIRNDRFIPKATDLFALQGDIFNDYWSSVKASYVFDNTINKAVNINYGTRFKVFGEFYRQIGKENSNMKVVGMDLRHYLKIHRELIFVSRLAGSSSFGKEKLVFYLGSVDDWWKNGDRFDFDQPIDFSQNYRFQTLASNMRGFIQNIRNGTSFAVINTEVRWPIFKYFIRRPIKSQVISNFQIIGFGDLGTAWTGLDPYSDDNALNSEEIVRNPFFITLKNNSEPIVGGYGFGVRSMLLGYFVRLDWAWGVKDEVIQDRIFYLSLSLDI